MNYWQRPSHLKLLSSKRRNKRYRLFYIWKSIVGLVPSLDLNMKTDRRYGPKIIIDNISGSIMRIQTLIEKSIHIAGARIFNSILKVLREFWREFPQFKKLVDMYLLQILDCPLIEGYTLHNLDSNLKISNSLIVWKENMNTVGWVPEAQSDESGDMLQ